MPTVQGFRRTRDSTTSQLRVLGDGQTRFDIGSFTLTTAGADSGSVLHGYGTSTTRATVGTASKKFISYYTESSATSGDSRGLYQRHYISGTGGGGEAARIFGTVQNVVASTVRGAHISLNFADTGTVTGLGVALECTLHIPNQGTQSGTMSPLKVAINSDGSTSDPSGAVLSYINYVNQGDTTGDDDVDTDVFFFNLQGHAAGSNTLFTTNTNADIDHSLKCRVDGVTYYIGLYDAIA